MDATIRKIDGKVYRKLKAVAVLNNVTIGSAVNEAMMMWIVKKNNGKNKL